MTERGRSEESYWGGGCSGWLGYLLGCLVAALIRGGHRHGWTIGYTIALVACGILLCLYVLWWVQNRRQRSRSVGTAGPVAQRDGWHLPVTRRTYPPAASGPAAHRPDLCQRHSSGRRRLNAGEIALAVGAAMSFLVGSLIVNAYASDARAGEPYWYSYAIAVLLASIVLGYALGAPDALKGMSERRKRDFVGNVLPALALLGLFLLFFAGMESVVNSNDTYLSALIFALIAGPFYALAFALFFRLLHTLLRWNV